MLNWGKLKTVGLVESGLNMHKIPVNWIPSTEEGAELFNEFYNYVLINRWPKYPLTPRGYISRRDWRMLQLPAYQIIVTDSSVQLNILDDQCAVLRYRAQPDKEKGEIRGGKGFRILRNVLERYNGNFEDIAIDNGAEVKKTILPPLIDVNPEYLDKEMTQCWHLDLNSAYMAGIKKYAMKSALDYPDADPRAQTYRALGQAIDEIYERRKENEGESRHYKWVLNVAQGYMQSQYCRLNGYPYALAHLAKAGIEHCRATIENIAAVLKEDGNSIIGFNTDGIWFYAPDYVKFLTLYKKQDKKLGGWHIDHKADRLRFRLKGAYEYEENGVYTPVVRGQTFLDRVKPRASWVWGDIYHPDARLVKFKFIEKIGLVPSNEKEIETYDW